MIPVSLPWDPLNLMFVKYNVPVVGNFIEVRYFIDLQTHSFMSTVKEGQKKFSKLTEKNLGRSLFFNKICE